MPTADDNQAATIADMFLDTRSRYWRQWGFDDVSSPEYRASLLRVIKRHRKNKRLLVEKMEAVAMKIEAPWREQIKRAA